MDHGLAFRQRARNDKARKSAARSNIHPIARLWHEIEKLKRIGDVSRPEMGNRRGGNQVCTALAFQEKRNEAVQALDCFT
jgi:hypothetical protein